MTAIVTTPALAPDPVITHRDDLLDAEVVSPLLAAMVDRTVGRVDIRRVKYRVGQSLRVLYEAHSGDASYLVSVRSFAQTPDPRSDATPWPSLDALAWRFPADRKITGLAALVDRTGELHEVVGQHDELVLEAYAPEKAATFRVTDRRSPGAGPDRHVKVLEPRAFRHASLRADTLPNLMRDASIRTPSLLARDRDLGALVWTHLDGTPATTSAEDCHAVGHLLARLHAIAPPPELPHHDRTGEAALRAATEAIAAVRPDVADAADELRRALESRRPRPGAVALLHGDVHPKNVLISAGEAGLIDLDQAVSGPAMADVGSLIAKFRELGAPSSSVDALVSGYRTQGGVVDLGELAWHTAAAMLGERASRAVTRCRLDVLDHLPSLLTRALDLIRTAP